MQSLDLHVSLELEGGCPGATLGVIDKSALVEGVGAMDVKELLECWKLGWKCWKNWMAHYGVCSKCIVD